MLQDKPKQIIFRDRTLEATVFEENGQTFVIAFIPPEGAKRVTVYNLDRLSKPVPLTTYWRPPIDACNKVQPTKEANQCLNAEPLTPPIERLKQILASALSKI
jgi:hypothetical protein